jgi:hypothetical protein
VNGRAVIRSLKPRIAQQDQDSAEVELHSGVNTVLVEVAQKDGDWGLYFRFEDAAGGRLRLTPKGELVPLTSPR